MLSCNEEMHFSFYLESLKLLDGEGIVLDLRRTDKILESAEPYGAKIYSHGFETWVSVSSLLQ